MPRRRPTLESRCCTDVTLDVIGGKWKPAILWHVHGDPRRFNELQRLLPGVTHKVLAHQLRELERDGVLSRTVYATVPPMVEYALTERGNSLWPILDALCDWGREHLRLEEGKETVPHARGA